MSPSGPDRREDAGLPEAGGGRVIPRSALEIEVPSRMEVVDGLEELAVRIGIAAGLREDGSHFLGVALREALANAVRHGNRLDPALPVSVEFRIEPSNTLVIAVRDRGAGFDPARLPDPRTSENLAKGSGRGIWYMRQFADEVSFSFPEGGGCVVLLKKRLPDLP